MEETNKMNETTKKEDQTSTQKIGIYLWIWLLLFVLSFFSYMVDWYQFQGMLRWSLISVSYTHLTLPTSDLV